MAALDGSRVADATKGIFCITESLIIGSISLAFTYLEHESMPPYYSLRILRETLHFLIFTSFFALQKSW